MKYTRTAPGRRAVAQWLLLPLLLAIPLATSVAAQQATITSQDGDTTQAPGTEATDSALLRGAEVYSQTCSACHQPGGVGLAGQFPPLLNNPAVGDSLYMETVVGNGLEGEIEVAGVLYDGRMPAFPTLPAEDVAAVIAYVQSGFAQPIAQAGLPAAQVSGDAGFPSLTGGAALLIYAIALALGFVVFSARIIAVNDRLTMSWHDALAKTSVIVVWFVLFTVLIPSWALQSRTVSKMSRNAQDLVGVGLWGAGLFIGLWVLWYAHRQKRL